MKGSTLKSIAVFTWRGHLPSDEEIDADPATRISADYGEQWANQAGQPVVTALLEAIRNLGHAVDAKSLCFDGHAWYFRTVLDGKSYSVLVQWIYREERRDAFMAQVFLLRGCIACLFRRRNRELELEPACKVLNDALGAQPMVADMEWVSEISW